MTQNKHKPGPWRLANDGLDNLLFDYENTLMIYDDQEYPSINLSDADFNLITAAPDLLAALKEARDHIAGSAPDWHYRTQEMLSAIDKAIDKAEGRE